MPFKRKDRNRIDDSHETLEALETETLHKAGSRNLKPMRCIETFYLCQSGLSNIHIIARLVGSIVLCLEIFKRKDRNRVSDSRETLEALRDRDIAQGWLSESQTNAMH